MCFANGVGLRLVLCVVSKIVIPVAGSVGRAANEPVPTTLTPAQSAGMMCAMPVRPNAPAVACVNVAAIYASTMCWPAVAKLH